MCITIKPMSLYRLLILFVFLHFGAVTIKADGQEVVGGIEVNGLTMCGKYTREQIFAALGGQPDRIVQEEEEPTYYEYHYGEDVFYHMGDEFYGGYIKTPRYSVSGGIKIGDNVVEINKLNGACYSGVYDKSKYAGVVRWRPSKDPKWEWLIVEFYYDAQGLIAGIEIHIFYL